jgi:hypothetical protein
VARRVISWIAAASAAFAGLYSLVLFGQIWPPDSRLPGFFIIGSVAIAATFLALRSRRRAAIVLLAFAPIAAFCGARAQSTIWTNDVVDAGLTCLFFLPIFLPLRVLRSRRWALSLFLLSASLAALVYRVLDEAGAVFPLFAGWSAALLLLGAFWFATDRLGWPPLIAPRPPSLVRRMASVFAAFILVAALDVVATFALVAWYSGVFSIGDGSGPRLFVQPWGSKHAAFTARLIRSAHTARTPKQWIGEWAIGIVEEPFWGIAPFLHPVLLTGAYFFEGDTYLIDGAREEGLLTQFLPIVRASLRSRTAPVAGENALQFGATGLLELRLLRHRPPHTGVHLLGILWRPAFKETNHVSTQPLSSHRVIELPPPRQPFAGARIAVNGPAGTVIVTADREGVFEVAGLPADNYTVQVIDLPDTQYSVEVKLEKKWLEPSKPFEVHLRVNWNGVVEGTLTQVGGGPARSRPVLLEAHDPAPYFHPMQYDDRTGTFRISELEPGRYVLGTNIEGPTDDSPYAPQFYRLGSQRSDAVAFDLAEGQHVKGINMALTPLARRNLHVRVTQPNGEPLAGAHIQIAYEHTSSFESLSYASSPWVTDPGGDAYVHVFGDSRIGVRAESSQPSLDLLNRSVYSPAVEIEGSKLPIRLDLVVSSSEPRLAR